MKKMDAKNYIVLKKNGVSGLTVGSKSLKPGSIFSENDWSYGQESLNVAIENERCEEIKDKSEKEDKKKESKNGNNK